MSKSSSTTTGKASRPASVRPRLTVRSESMSRKKPIARATVARADAIDEKARHKMISECAYFRAEHRAFSGNGELDDWLEAEREIEHKLRH